ncbi:hypothetical protein RRG08_015251 [Elysia crispata]|uniref:Uncharacterized protein n=1 Tax=Elysia crispata TaxID=231223 RepID=A0AAE0Z1N7_9GAST|nr:hypothetical protein RRG08_015251 [Elysia crispata]
MVAPEQSEGCWPKGASPPFGSPRETPPKPFLRDSFEGGEASRFGGLCPPCLPPPRFARGWANNLFGAVTTWSLRAGKANPLVTASLRDSFEGGEARLKVPPHQLRPLGQHRRHPPRNPSFGGGLTTPRRVGGKPPSIL